MQGILDQRYEKKVALSKLKPHPANPRKGDKGAIAQSIRSNGFYGALIVQTSTGYILAGNHRFEAAKDEGIEHLPVFWLNVDDSEAKRILAADNRANDLAGYDDRPWQNC